MPRTPRTRTSPNPNPALSEPPNDGTQTDLVRATISVFEPDFDTLNLQQKIARITGMIGGVQKRGYNAFHKYSYVTEADLVTAVRQYLAVAGIVIIPNAHAYAQLGDMMVVEIEYTVTDGNEAFTFSMPGAGSDKGDKGIYKAITGSQKYALMKLFKIETGDDPEADTRVDERAHVSAGPPSRPTEVRTGERAGVGRGAHTTLASPVQIRRIAEIMKEEALERTELVTAVKNLFDDDLLLPEDDKAAGAVIIEYLQKLESGKIGELIIALSAYADAKNIPDGPGYG